MNIKAICTDIDGTLLNSERQLSAKTIETFSKLPKDLPIILASSRMPSAMRHLQAELKILEHPLICFNGGYVIEYGPKHHSIQVFDSVHIPPSVCAGIVSLTYGTDIHVSLYANDLWYAPAHDKWTEREETITKVKAIIAAPDQVLAEWMIQKQGAHKVMCMGPEPEIEALQKVLEEKFSENIHIYRSRPTYLELAPRVISKATALALILQRSNISMENVLAFGDNYNDIDLIQTVGLGIAVENARDEVKAVAKIIAPKSIEDGVAVVLAQYFAL